MASKKTVFIKVHGVEVDNELYVLAVASPMHSPWWTVVALLAGVASIRAPYHPLVGRFHFKAVVMKAESTTEFQ